MSREQIHRLIENAPRITVLTGAGVSTDSGIPDFYSLDSTWGHEKSREELTSLDYFKENPQHFWKVYRELFAGKGESLPNVFHQYIASLESNHDVTVITQNVDGLHGKAGSSHVIEVHGSMKTLVDIHSEDREEYDASEYEGVELPLNLDGLPLKPGVVLFGEPPQKYDEAKQAISQSDLLIVAGASLRVSPVSFLPFIAQDTNIPTVWMGRTAPPHIYDFTMRYRGELSEFPL